MVLSRSISSGILVAIALLPHALAARAEGPAAVQAGMPSDVASDTPKTLKERLGDKASDDQRVDNCKVAADRRGPKARPDDCSHQSH